MVKLGRTPTPSGCGGLLPDTLNGHRHGVVEDAPRAVPSFHRSALGLSMRLLLFLGWVRCGMKRLAKRHPIPKYLFMNQSDPIELNHNAPLSLLMKVIKLINENYKDSNGLSFKEIPLLLVWKDNNAEEIFSKIK